jgi:hypothetical protein
MLLAATDGKYSGLFEARAASRIALASSSRSGSIFFESRKESDLQVQSWWPLPGKHVCICPACMVLSAAAPAAAQ